MTSGSPLRSESGPPVIANSMHVADHVTGRRARYPKTASADRSWLDPRTPAGRSPGLRTTVAVATGCDARASTIPGVA